MAKTTIYSWNVNGVRAAERKGFLEWLGSCHGDVVAIQETKASPEQLSKNLLEPAGFNSYWSSATIRKGYSGVATFSKTVPDKVVVGFAHERFDADGRVLITEYPNFVLFNIYFPNGGRGMDWVHYKLEFYTKFLEVVKTYTDQGKPVVAVGDVNTAYTELDLARPKENVKHSGFMPIEREALGKFYEAGLVDTFRLLHPDKVAYSYWDQKSRARDRNVGWRIDYAFISSDLRDKVVSADILDDVLGSDHAPISLVLDL